MNEQYRANKNCPSDQEAHEGAKGKASEACPTRKYSRSDGEIRALTIFRKKRSKTLSHTIYLTLLLSLLIICLPFIL